MKNKISEKARTIIGAILFAIFSAMFAIGSQTGEVTLVIRKAASICLECIGIGK